MTSMNKIKVDVEKFNLSKTNKRLMNKAISYLSKYSTNSKRLELVLHKHTKKYMSEIPSEILSLEIDKIVFKFKELGYFNDMSFAYNKIKEMIHHGLSSRNIKSKFSFYSIKHELGEKILDELHEENTNIELKSALIYAKRKNMGPYKKSLTNIDKDTTFIRWMNAFGRAGFTYDLSKKVLTLSSISEAEEILLEIKLHSNDNIYKTN